MYTTDNYFLAEAKEPILADDALIRSVCLYLDSLPGAYSKSAWRHSWCRVAVLPCRTQIKGHAFKPDMQTTNVPKRRGWKNVVCRVNAKASQARCIFYWAPHRQWAVLLVWDFLTLTDRKANCTYGNSLFAGSQHQLLSRIQLTNRCSQHCVEK